MLETISPAILDRIAGIELLLLDVDGVLTDGRIVYGDDRVEIKAFHVRDGSAIKIWRELGKKIAIITGRTSKVVERRAAELGIPWVYQGAHRKLDGLRKLLDDSQIRPDQIGAIGDDLPDIPILRHAAFGVAVADACQELKDVAHYVTHAPGGCGAVREVIELVLKQQGHWFKIVDSLRNESFHS